MEALLMIAALIAGVVLLGAAASLWGIDSRDPMPDDHRR
jgi:hypothetical protein